MTSKTLSITPTLNTAKTSNPKMTCEGDARNNQNKEAENSSYENKGVSSKEGA